METSEAENWGKSRTIDQQKKNRGGRGRGGRFYERVCK